MAAAPKKPPLTTTRYKQMVRELAHLYEKYQGDLDEIIPFMAFHIASAMQRADRMTKPPNPGAPSVWTPGQLARLWVTVRAQRIRNPSLTAKDVCLRLAAYHDWYFDDYEQEQMWRQGYEVWAEEPRSVNGEEVRRFITNGEQLRRRFVEAERYLKAYPKARQNLEQEARWLVANSQKIGRK